MYRWYWRGYQYRSFYSRTFRSSNWAFCIRLVDRFGFWVFRYNWEVMSLLSPVIFSLAFAEWYAKYDFKVYTQGFILRHTSRAIIRFIVLLFASVLSADRFDNGIYFPTTCILFLGLSCSLFWLWFELRFNYLLDEDDPFYIGKTAWSDRTLREIGINGIQLFFLKIALILFLLFTILIHLLR